MDFKMPKPKDKMARKPINKIAMKIALIILIVLAVLGAIYLCLQYSGYINAFKLAMQIQKQQQLTADDQKVLNQLKKIIELPKDVTPTMGIINDADKIRQQDPNFFANAKNGDRLVAYPNFAILFDVHANKIMNIGTLNLPAAKVPVAIYNGTKSNARLAEFQEKLLATFKNVEVTIKQPAATLNYAKTLVIDLVGNNPDIQKIAEALGAQVSPLPAGETAPTSTALLIIVGAK